MTEKIEQIMKRIHVLFTKCTPVDHAPDKIIVPKRQLFSLLEELNIVINDVMEQYEVTERSRERAKRKFEEKGEKIIENATKNAEDVYAASMLYTDRMLIDLRSVVEQASHDLKKEYDLLAEKISSQITMIEENQEEVRGQLKGLSQSEKYMDIIDHYNDRIMEKRRAALMAEEELTEHKTEAYSPADEIDISEIEDSLINSIGEVLGDLDIGPVPAADGEEVLQKAGGKGKPKHPVKPQNKKQIKKVASVVDEAALSDAPEDTVKRVSYEIKVNPWYGAEGGAFTSADLDAEYEQWKGTEAASSVEKEPFSIEEVAVSQEEEVQIKEKNKKKGLAGKKKR